MKLIYVGIIISGNGTSSLLINTFGRHSYTQESAERILIKIQLGQTEESGLSLFGLFVWHINYILGRNAPIRFKDMLHL